MTINNNKKLFCFDCKSNEIVINPNEANIIEYWCCNCRKKTTTILKSEINEVYK